MFVSFSCSLDPTHERDQWRSSFSDRLVSLSIVLISAVGSATETMTSEALTNSNVSRSSCAPRVPGQALGGARERPREVRFPGPSLHSPTHGTLHGTAPGSSRETAGSMPRVGRRGLPGREATEQGSERDAPSLGPLLRRGLPTQASEETGGVVSSRRAHAGKCHMANTRPAPRAGPSSKTADPQRYGGGKKGPVSDGGEAFVP